MPTPDMIAYILAESPDYLQVLALCPFVFPCPMCGHEFHQTFGWFDINDQIICPNCKETIVFDAKEFRGRLRELATALSHLWMSIGYLT